MYWLYLAILINPRCMRRRVMVVVVCVCVSVYLSVTVLAATYHVCMSKMRHHRVPSRLLKICIVWIKFSILDGFLLTHCSSFRYLDHDA